MGIFENASGYAPLLVNLEGHWETSFDDLPELLKPLVQEAFLVFSWDSLDSTNRRHVAAQIDYQRDPVHEPVAYFKLFAFSEELKGWIEKARAESKDAAVVVLRDVADRIDKILTVDRERVGAEIQSLREAKSYSEPAKDLATRERTTLLTVIALLAGEAKVDWRKPTKAAELILTLADTAGVSLGQRTVEEHLKKIPDALERSGKT